MEGFLELGGKVGRLSLTYNVLEPRMAPPSGGRDPEIWVVGPRTVSSATVRQKGGALRDLRERWSPNLLEGISDRPKRHHDGRALGRLGP